MAVLTEKANTERDEILVKFSKNELNNGPFANKVKNLQNTEQKVISDLHAMEDLASQCAIQSWAEVRDIAETIQNMLIAWTALKQLCGAAWKMKGNSEKPQAVSFRMVMRQARGKQILHASVPQEYQEIDLKLDVIGIFDERNEDALPELISLGNLGARIMVEGAA